VAPASSLMSSIDFVANSDMETALPFNLGPIEGGWRPRSPPGTAWQAAALYSETAEPHPRGRGMFEGNGRQELRRR